VGSSQSAPSAPILSRHRSPPIECAPIDVATWARSLADTADGARLCRMPASSSATFAEKSMTTDARVALDHSLGRYVLGSMRSPAMPARPRPAQVRPGHGDRELRRVRLAATATATAMGQGAAIPAPHPVKIPARTDSGTRTPNGRPSTLSRIATIDVTATVPANPTAAARSARPVSRGALVVMPSLMMSEV